MCMRYIGIVFPNERKHDLNCWECHFITLQNHFIHKIIVIFSEMEKTEMFPVLRFQNKSCHYNVFEWMVGSDPKVCVTVNQSKCKCSLSVYVTSFVKKSSNFSTIPHVSNRSPFASSYSHVFVCYFMENDWYVKKKTVIVYIRSEKRIQFHRDEINFWEIYLWTSSSTRFHIAYQVIVMWRFKSQNWWKCVDPIIIRFWSDLEKKG